MNSFTAIKNKGNFGRVIRKIRENLFLSQEKFSEKIGVSREWISDIERGKSSPNYLDTLKLIQAAGFKSMDELNRFLDEAIPETPESDD
ncbi:MAG: helix-turn-helix domain-containing protein [Clostridiales bacterium]|nr:helix-turn-helix domain-containing protein [Clostridiales bacterium]